MKWSQDYKCNHAFKLASSFLLSLLSLLSLHPGNSPLRTTKHNEGKKLLTRKSTVSQITESQVADTNGYSPLPFFRALRTHVKQRQAVKYDRAAVFRFGLQANSQDKGAKSQGRSPCHNGVLAPVSLSALNFYWFSYQIPDSCG